LHLFAFDCQGVQVTEAQEEFVEGLKECRAEIIHASGEFDAMEGHGPGGQHAIGAALSAIDAAIQIEEEYRPKAA
jgi:hypothetical protein